MDDNEMIGKKAPEWHIKSWIDTDGKSVKVYLKDYLGKVVFLLCFQSWCPGCHSIGFPTLQKMQETFKNNTDVALFAIQTVFEGFESNTEEMVRKEQLRYTLHIPMGHDPGEGISTILQEYHTHGTPWIVIIDKKGFIRYNDFHIEMNIAIELIASLLINNN